jgi:site-specific DNA-cytosine methylase
MSQESPTPRNIHSLWMLLKEDDDLDKKNIEKIRQSILVGATKQDIKELLELGLSMGLLSESNKNELQKTTEGISFSKAENWRIWKPSEKVRELLGIELTRTFFVDSKENISRPVVIDLFAGVGGLSSGFEAAGFNVKVAVDNDPQACEAHEKNFPECIVIKEDINEIAADPKKLLCLPAGIDPSKVAGVIGGPPCQGFSYMGERASADERNLLTSRYMDVVLDLEPDFFLMENVAGLLTSGALPKIGSYIQRLGKSIGEPATHIVECLPEVASIVAKRDRQFRKRTVSKLITNYRFNLDIRVSDNFSIADGVPLLSEIYKSLPGILESGIIDAYSSEDCESKDAKKISDAISSSKEEIARLSIGIIVDILIEKNILTEGTCEHYLSLVSSEKRVPAEVKKSIAKIIATYDSSPKSSVYKGVTVGPVIAHLITRATEKYDVSAPTLLNSSWFGTPQSRQRLFLIGIHKRHNKTFIFPRKKYALPGVKRNDLDLDLPTAPNVLEAIGDLPDIDKFESLRNEAEFFAKYLKKSESDYASFMRLDSIAPGDMTLPRPTWNPFVVDCSNRTIHTDDVIERLKKTEEGIQEETSHKTRLNRTKVSHTLRAGTREGKGSHTAVRPVHYDHHRVISVREGARLMGYPDWMTFHHTKWHGFRLVGNGVPFHLGKAIAQEIIRQLNLAKIIDE